VAAPVAVAGVEALATTEPEVLTEPLGG